MLLAIEDDGRSVWDLLHGSKTVEVSDVEKVIVHRRDNLFARVHDSGSELLEMMRTYGVLCCGSVVLKIAIPDLPGEEFDFIVPVAAIQNVKAIFDGWGYVAEEESDMEYKTQETATEDVRSVIKLKHMTKTVSVVLIQSAGEDVMKTLLSFYGTAAMNFISHGILFMAYPEETFAMINVVNAKYYTTYLTNVDETVDKWRSNFLATFEAMGFTNKFLPYSNHKCGTVSLCCKTLRQMEDSMSLVVKLDGFQFVDPMALGNEWTLGGDSEFCPQSYNTIINQIDADNDIFSNSAEVGAVERRQSIARRIRTVVTDIHLDVDQVLFMMSQYGLVCCGWRALQVAFPEIRDEDFQFIVPFGALGEVVAVFESWGYGRAVMSEAPTGVWRGVDTNLLGSCQTMKHDRDSFNVILGQSKNESVLTPLLNEVETGGMNFFTANAFYMAYPGLTLRKVTLCRCASTTGNTRLDPDFRFFIRGNLEEPGVRNEIERVSRVSRSLYDEYGLLVVYHGRTLGVETSNGDGSEIVWTLTGR